MSQLASCEDAVEQALEQADHRADIMLEQVETVEEAERLGFRGSPTILIDGVDPFAVGDESPGIFCRVYQTETGPDGSPSVAQLLSVFVSS